VSTKERTVPALFLGPVSVYWKDNQIVKPSRTKEPAGEKKNYSPGLLLEEIALAESPPIWPKGLVTLHASEVKKHVLENAGAFPWERDQIDRQIIDGAASGQGKIIDSETEAGGYPDKKPVYGKFNASEWDLVTMTKKSIFSEKLLPAAK